ncbi:AfsR/SARP family transcriptional regulator [Nocardiopsis rhodophaea]
MRFGILGTTEVWGGDGTPVATGGVRRRAVLIVLALEAGRVVSTERLIDDVYGEAPPVGAANALQSQISRLRGALRTADGGDLVESHPGGYRLAVDPLDVDAYRFEWLAAAGQDALVTGDHARASALLGEALSLWRGPALADVATAPFAAAPAHRLSELRLSAVENRIEARLACGASAALVSELEELVAAYPLRERLRGQLMRALQAAGRQAEALVVFEEVRTLLAEELGVGPSSELSRIHLAILRGEPTEVTEGPAGLDELPRAATLGMAAPRDVAASGARPPLMQTIPAQLTSFVGAERQLAEISALLGEARLVTLTGPGGVGKTRLAVEAARRDDSEVCFVELSLIDAGSDVPQAVLTALGLRDSGLVGSLAPDRQPPPADPTARLAAALMERSLLLVLDNCEHVLEDAARLAGRLLSDCPGLRILATSQETLGITGETLWPVSPLPLPPVGCCPQEALNFSAVRLFADRAAAARPGFAVTADNVGEIVAVCRALDGLPLAIELAAARLRALPLAEIAGRLDDRFALLARGNRMAQPKHQTLRAVVAWSWSLLDETEQRLARRFTVFTGGATLAAVRAVCGDSDEVADALSGLVEKSLVEALDGGRRYRMLATIRAYGDEHLAEAGEQEGVQRAHAAYFLDLAQAADPHLRNASQLEWLPLLSAEHDNLHAALRWAVEHDTTMALRLLAALSVYWWLRGRHNEGASLAGALLRRIGFQAPEELVEEYVLCVVNAMSDVSGVGRPEPYLDRAEEIVAGLDAPLRWPLLAMLWPTTAGQAGRGSAGIRPFLDRCQASADPWVRAVAQLVLGYLQFYQGDPGRAGSAFTSGLAAFQSLGDHWGSVQALAGLSAIAAWQGDLTRTLTLTDEALVLTEQLGAAEDGADLVRLRAEGLLRGGDLDGARASFERATEIARQNSAREVLVSAQCGLGTVARLRGDHAEARRCGEASVAGIADGAAGGGAVRMQAALIELGRLAEAEGDTDQARACYRRALVGDMSSWHLPQVTLAAEALADVALLDGDAEHAALLLGASAAVRGGRDVGCGDVARVANAARAMIGAEVFSAAYVRGSRLSREEVFTELGAAIADLGG